MSKSKHQPLLVQKLITSYFPASRLCPVVLSLSIEFGSICCTVYSKSDDSLYILATPESKQGNLDFYLWKCNTLEESQGHALSIHASSVDAYSYPTSSFGLTKSWKQPSWPLWGVGIVDRSSNTVWMLKLRLKLMNPTWSKKIKLN